MGMLLKLVVPPHVMSSGDSTVSCTCSLTLASSSDSWEPAVTLKHHRAYAMSQSKQCHFLLQLICLKNRSQKKVMPRLATCHFKPFVCDNGINLLPLIWKKLHMYLAWHTFLPWWYSGSWWSTVAFKGCFFIPDGFVSTLGGHPRWWFNWQICISNMWCTPTSSGVTSSQGMIHLSFLITGKL